jgi:hypothetical protein
MSIMLWLEQYIFRNRSECVFDISKQKHVILLPGMIGPVWMIFGLVRYLRTYQSDYGVTVIPLGLSLDSFDALVKYTVSKITQNLIEKTSVTEIVLHGHSHGGRVACAVYQELQKRFPDIRYAIITAGTPIEKPKYIKPKKRFRVLPLASKAFRDWPQILQPDKEMMHYIGLYSDYDRIVPPQYAVSGHAGELRMLAGFTHTDFIRAQKMGPIMIQLLQEVGMS